MNWRLELVVVPVTDVERAKSFYTDKLGFNLDHDVQASDTMRVVQLTPPGSACSIAIGMGIAKSVPGSLQGLQLVVNDIQAARAELMARGVEVTEVQRLDPRDGGAFVFFSDPDGNGWSVQEIRARD